MTVPPRARAPPVSRRRVSVLPPSPGLATSPMLSASVAVPVPAPVPRLSAVSAARSLPRLSPARLSVAPGPTVSAVTSAGCARPPGSARRAPPEADRALVAVTGPLKVRMPPSASVAPLCAYVPPAKAAVPAPTLRSVKAPAPELVTAPLSAKFWSPAPKVSWAALPEEFARTAVPTEAVNPRRVSDRPLRSRVAVMSAAGLRVRLMGVTNEGPARRWARTPSAPRRRVPLVTLKTPPFVVEAAPPRVRLPVPE